MSDPGLADVALFAWYIGVLVLLEGLLERRQRAGAGGHGPASPQESTAPGALSGESGEPSGFAFLPSCCHRCC